MGDGWLMRGLLEEEEGGRGLEEAPAAASTPSPAGASSSSLPAAERAADAGMEQALHAERVAVWKERADRWLDEQLRGSLFTADELVAAIGLPDTGQARNNAVGAWVNAQQRQGRIEFTGRMSKSRRVEGHGNLQRLWRVKLDNDRHQAGGDAEHLGPDGVSSSLTGSAYPTQKAKAATAPEASEGWDDQADPEQTCDGGHGQDVAPTGSAEGARAEAALTVNDGEGGPGSALNADDLADAPPGGPPDVGEQRSLWEAA